MSVHEVLGRPEPANFIDNTWVPSTGEAVEVRDPAQPSEVVALVPDATEQEVSAAIESAAQAFPDWAATPASARTDILRRWNSLIDRHADELAQLITREMGKPLAESRGELGRARGEIEYAAGEGTRLCGATIPSSSAGQLVYTELVPLGVVGAITPWNFPAVAPARKIAPALVAGNTVVLKAALETPLTAFALAALLRDAGLPDGVLNVVAGRGPTVGAQIAADPRVAGVSFTGSTGVGRTVGEVVGRRLGKVQLELGGKNAAYVHSAADLSKVAAQITNAAIQATGQRCTAISRVIVNDDLADELVGLLSDTYASYVVGPGLAADTQVGPLVSQAQYERVDRYVQKGLAEGAVRVTSLREVPAGLYYPPTVFDRVTPEMVIAQEEIFGPVLTVTRVTDVDEAIWITNNTEYGLASVVFSQDLEVAMRFARECKTGMVHINHGTISQAHVPFGGVKNSGAGAFSIGFTNKDFFTDTKVVYLSPTVG